MKKEWIKANINVLGVSKTADDTNFLGHGHGWLPNGCHQNCGEHGKFPEHGGHHPHCPNRPGHDMRS